MSIKIGTRGSKLALAQTEIVCRTLSERKVEVETVIIRTQGDTNTTAPLHEIGGQGVFVRALDEAIERGEIDAAVHSMKDIPAYRPEGLCTCAILPRDSPADFLVFEGDISHISTIGTSSTRRQAQLLRHDSSICIKPLRGNLDTRIRRLVEGDFDAVVVAEAGLQRMGYHVTGQRLPPRQFVPTTNQGTIAVVCRKDPSLIETLTPLDHQPTRKDVLLERAVMEEVGGGCYTPLGIFCQGGHLLAEILSLDGSRRERLERDLTSEADARQAGRDLRVRGAELIEQAHSHFRRGNER